MKKRNILPRKPSLYTKLKRLIKSDSVITIEYVYHDGGKRSKILSDKFIKDRKGKVRKVNHIISDIFALMHDYKAKYFKI